MGFSSVQNDSYTVLPSSYSAQNCAQFRHSWTEYGNIHVVQ